MRYSTLQLRSLVTAIVVVSVVCATNVSAASWNGIEPFKTHRDDVLKIMGQPVGESPEGVLRFNVSGGSVQISFVNEKFVASKRLRPELAGAVLEIVLQHQQSSATAESMKLLTNKDFIRDDVRNISVFRSPKLGIVYTFIEGILKTTRYTFEDAQMSRARR